ncbi:GntR family transcriptional regulator [Celeribacter sp.]|uniref:GntR family transcriptional regulator n=1 Tax=Celeribacter sp. TaxID=1890673 RepID=UPI003A941CE7
MSKDRTTYSEMAKGSTGDTPSARDRHDAMHHVIRERICLLDYPPTMRLSETELAEEFGTSRTPLRRVLARLEDEGLVRSLHGVGTIVTDLDRGELTQVYHLRLELISLSGRLDPLPPTPAFLDRLDTLIARAREVQSAHDPRAFTRLDIDTFEHLNGLIGNLPLRRINAQLYYQTKRIWLAAAIAAKLDLDMEFALFHRELVDVRAALSVGDLQAAADLQRAHISMSFQRLQPHLA